MTWYRALPGPQKGPLLAQNAPFGDPGDHRRARFGPNCRRLVRIGWTHGHHTLRVDIRPFCGGQGPNLVQKGIFWAKTGPVGAPGGPVKPRYQAKVYGGHESIPGGPIGGSWDHIWSSRAHRGPPGPPKGISWPKRALLGAPKGHFVAKTSPFGGPRSALEVS